MKVVLRNDEYTIYQRRDGRYAVEGADKKAINGDEKVAILVANDLIKAALPAAPEPEPVEGSSGRGGGRSSSRRGGGRRSSSRRSSGRRSSGRRSRSPSGRCRRRERLERPRV
jgi:hypothetical protein